MITAAVYEDLMQENKKTGDINRAIIDTVCTLKGMGYDAGADILKSMWECEDADVVEQE